MIRILSKKIAKWLAKEGVVSDTDRDLFEYAVYSLLFGLSPVFIAAFWGLIFDMIFEGLILIVPFILLRKFSGGKHLDSPGACILVSICVIAGAFCLMQWISTKDHQAWLIIPVLISIASLWILSPIDSESRKLSPAEVRQFGQIARVLSVGTGVVYLYFVTAENNAIAIPIGVSIVMTALLQIPALMDSTIRKKG